MSVELIVNIFWFLSILTVLIYITKKKYIRKKGYDLINNFFKFLFILSILLLLVSLYSLINK